jgi:hypothetical protein
MHDFVDKAFHFLCTSLCPGTSETQVFDEQSPSGKDYLAEVKGIFPLLLQNYKILNLIRK